MKQISIPSPCSEDWNTMTPTEKGAFCRKCSLEVIDFTKKSSEEIRETLVLNLGKKVCGHIGKHQLQTVNSNFYMWENQSPQILRSKFLYACILVFGMTLFTGCENNNTEEINGGIEQHDVGMMEMDSTTHGDDDATKSCDTTNAGESNCTTDIKGRMTIDDEPVDGMMEMEE